jgi:PAS domain S-box-containing protein
MTEESAKFAADPLTDSGLDAPVDDDDDLTMKSPTSPPQESSIANLAASQRLILDTANEGFCLFSKDVPPRVEAFNQRFVSLFGLNSDWLNTRPTAEQVALVIYRKLLVRREDPTGYLANVLERHVQPGGREIELRMKDGRRLSGRTQSAPGGARLYTFRDITAERQVLSELAAERERLSVMVEHGPVAYYVIDCRDSKTIEIGRSIRYLTGRNAEDFIDRPHEWEDLVHPQDWKGVSRKIRDAIANRRPYDLEYRVYHLNGSVRWFRDMAEPIPERDCLPTQLAGVVIDITRTKTAEKNLRESERKFRELIEGISDFIFYEHDVQRRITYVSPSVTRVLGQPQDNLVGRRFGESSDPLMEDGMAKAREAVAAAIESRRRQPPYEARIRHAAGHWVVLEIMEYPVMVNDKVIGFRGIARDVTELRDLERKLNERERLAILGTFAGGLAHDLNNLLLPIRAGLDALERDPNPERVGERVAVIRRATDHIAELTSKLYVWTRQSDTSSTGAIVANVTEWFDDAMEIYHDVVTGKGAAEGGKPWTVSLKMRKPPKTVQIDPDLLKQAILNLVLNARDAMPMGGRISIQVDRSPGYWYLQPQSESEIDRASHAARFDEDTAGSPLPDNLASEPNTRYRPAARISVTDQGSGMEERVLARAFDPFFSTKSRGKSTGLGLALVNSIIRSVGGRVQIESELGKGTTVILDVPAARREEFRPVEVESVKTGGALISLDDPWAAAFVQSSMNQIGLVARVDRDAAPGPTDVVWFMDPARTEPGEVRSHIDRLDQLLVLALTREDDRPGWPEGIIWLDGAVDTATIRRAVREKLASDSGLRIGMEGENHPAP